MASGYCPEGKTDPKLIVNRGRSLIHTDKLISQNVANCATIGTIKLNMSIQ